MTKRHHFYLLTLLLCFVRASAGDMPYETTPNTSAFPLPYELPLIQNQTNEGFDWERYFKTSQSEADRIYRKHLAYWDYGIGLPEDGISESNADIVTRANLAAQEFNKKCDELIQRYRTQLADNEAALETLNEYIATHQQLNQLELKFIADSWEGGSGYWVALAQAKAGAYIHFHSALQGLQSSLFLQE